MSHKFIDINCDVGEGMGNEEALMPYISSCSMACGGHAGNKDSMTQVVRLAKRFNVKIGAHPSYPDKVNFGRQSMKMSKGQFVKSIQEQLQNLLGILEEENATLNHIKAHGALYNDLAKDAELAKNFLFALSGFKNKAALYVPYKAVIEKEAIDAGFQIKREAFADRNYNDDLSLVSRKLPNALLEKPQDVLEHVISMVQKNEVKTIQGKNVKIYADTYCIHSDTANALQILMYLTSHLPENKIHMQGA